MTKLALTLSGGGSKGAYEIGVYRALRKLKKNPQIVTGTSVGAINGMLIVQGDLYKSVKLWRNISFDTIYDESDFEACPNDTIQTIYKQYIKSFITEGGMDIGKLIKTFDEYYDPKKFKTSPIDFGLVTYNLTQNKPVIKTKDQMNEKEVKDYIIASASCYPAFKPYKINNELYIDGGYYDNMPINLAIDMGADEIVAVDLGSIGFKNKPKKNIPIITITPRNKIVSFLIFDQTKSRQALHFGYNDTMKTFGKLDGDKFTFKKGSLVKNYNKYAEVFDTNLHQILDSKNKLINKIISIPIIQTYINERVSYPNFNALIEKAGFCYNFDEDIIYSIKSYNLGLFNELLETTPLTKNQIAKKIKNKDFNLINKKQVVRYFYDCIATNRYDDAFPYVALFTEEFLIALYIYTIKGKRKAY